MPKKRPENEPAPAVLRELVGQFLGKLIEQHGREAVEAAVSDALTRRPGRPGIDDRAALEYMHEALLSGKAKTPTEAARQALRLGLAESYVEESDIRRLRDKYRKQKAEIAARAAVGQAVKGFYDLYADLIEARRAFLEPGERVLKAASAFAARGEAVERAFREMMVSPFSGTEKK